MKITYEDIVKANQAIKTTDIKGKNYAEVVQRVKAFRMVFPTGTINTHMVSNENGVCIFRATVGYLDEDFQEFVILGEGTAYEKEGSSFINKTSYIENCETSAVGRALGMAGFGIDESMASYEEVANAKLNQEVHKITDDGIKKLLLAFSKAGIKTEDILEKYNIKDLKDITKEQYVEALKLANDTFESNAKEKK